MKSQVVQDKIHKTCQVHTKVPQCEQHAGDALFCQLLQRSSPEMAAQHCGSKAKTASFLQLSLAKAPEDKLAPFGKEDTAKELQDHAAKTQDTLVDAVENAE